MKDAFVERYTDKACMIGLRDESKVNVNMSKEGKQRRQDLYLEIMKEKNRKQFSKNEYVWLYQSIYAQIWNVEYMF